MNANMDDVFDQIYYMIEISVSNVRKFIWSPARAVVSLSNSICGKSYIINVAALIRYLKVMYAIQSAVK